MISSLREVSDNSREKIVEASLNILSAAVKKKGKDEKRKDERKGGGEKEQNSQHSSNINFIIIYANNTSPLLVIPSSNHRKVCSNSSSSSSSSSSLSSSSSQFSTCLQMFRSTSNRSCSPMLGLPWVSLLCSCCRTAHKRQGGGGRQRVGGQEHKQ